MSHCREYSTEEMIYRGWICMYIKRKWLDFWKGKHKHSSTHSREAVRSNKQSIHLVEFLAEKPRIKFDSESSRWMCISVVHLMDLNTGRSGWLSRKTGLGSTAEDAFDNWDRQRFERKY